MLLEGCIAEAVGANQPRVKDLAASLRNRHAGAGRSDCRPKLTPSLPRNTQHSSGISPGDGHLAPPRPGAWLELCASRESKKTNTAGSSEMDCDWLRRLQVTKSSEMTRSGCLRQTTAD